MSNQERVLEDKETPKSRIVKLNDLLMKDNQENMDVNFGDANYLSIKSSFVVTLKQEFVLFTEEGGITLEADVTADLAKVPEKYRGVFINMLTSKYMNKASVVDNSFHAGINKDDDKINLKTIFNRWVKKFS